MFENITDFNWIRLFFFRKIFLIFYYYFGLIGPYRYNAKLCQNEDDDDDKERIK